MQQRQQGPLRSRQRLMRLGSSLEQLRGSQGAEGRWGQE